jgi:hypothetical protein
VEKAVDSGLSMDTLAASMEATEGAPLRASHLSAECKEAALSSLSGRRAQYAAWSAAQVESHRFSDVAFWDLVVLVSEDTVPGGVLGQCVADTMQRFIKLRIVDDQIVPSDPLITGQTDLNAALKVLGKDAYTPRKKRAIWLTDRREAPTWTSEKKPLFVRQLQIADTDIRQALGLSGTHSGAALIIY